MLTYKCENCGTTHIISKPAPGGWITLRCPQCGGELEDRTENSLLQKVDWKKARNNVWHIGSTTATSPPYVYIEY